MAARQFARGRRHTKSILYKGTPDVRGRRVAIAVEFPVPNLAKLPRLYLTDRVRDLPDAVAHERMIAYATRVRRSLFSIRLTRAVRRHFVCSKCKRHSIVSLATIFETR